MRTPLLCGGNQRSPLASCSYTAHCGGALDVSDMRQQTRHPIVASTSHPMHGYSGGESGGGHGRSVVAISRFRELTPATGSAAFQRSTTSFPVSRAAFASCLITIFLATVKYLGSAWYLADTQWRRTMEQAIAVRIVLANWSTNKSPGWLKQDRSSCSRQFNFCAGRSGLAAPVSLPPLSAIITRLSHSGSLTLLMSFL